MSDEYRSLSETYDQRISRVIYTFKIKKARIYIHRNMNTDTKFQPDPVTLQIYYANLAHTDHSHGYKILAGQDPVEIKKAGGPAPAFSNREIVAGLLKY